MTLKASEPPIHKRLQTHYEWDGGPITLDETVCGVIVKNDEGVTKLHWAKVTCKNCLKARVKKCI